jgi:hypothetical protein
LEKVWIIAASMYAQPLSSFSHPKLTPTHLLTPHPLTPHPRTPSSIILLPLLTYSALLDLLLRSKHGSKADRIVEARALGMGIFLGTLALFGVPYAGWKVVVRIMCPFLESVTSPAGIVTVTDYFAHTLVYMWGDVM